VNKDKDYYAILGVKRESSPDEIKDAYRRLALKYHPDLCPEAGKAEAAEKFKSINEAHEALSDPQKKAEYDQLWHGEAVVEENISEKWEESVEERIHPGAGLDDLPKQRIPPGNDLLVVRWMYFMRAAFAPVWLGISCLGFILSGITHLYSLCGIVGPFQSLIGILNYGSFVIASVTGLGMAMRLTASEAHGVGQYLNRSPWAYYALMGLLGYAAIIFLIYPYQMSYHEFRQISYFIWPKPVVTPAQVRSWSSGWMMFCWFSAARQYTALVED
jgi:hypothetical protein